IVGKWAGAFFAARISGLRPRESAVLAALMNTRGLTELIVLNIGLEAGAITPALFAMLVLVALVTTFMTGPSLQLLDPLGAFAAPPEDALRRAPREAPAAAPQRALLVAALDRRNLPALVGLGELLARSEPPRELILSRLLAPAPAGLGLAA